LSQIHPCFSSDFCDLATQKVLKTLIVILENDEHMSSHDHVFSRVFL